MFKLFTSRRFFPLFNVQFLGSFNDNAFKNAFIVWLSYGMAKELGLNADLIVSLAAGLFILPFFLFSAFAGTLADKFDKQVITKIIKLAEIVIMSLGVVAFYMQSVPCLLVVLFALGVQSSFFGPIKYSLLPTHLRSDELLLGNSLIEAGTFLSVLAGTIAGGLLINLDHGTLYISILVMTASVIGWGNSFLIPKAPASEQGKQLKADWNVFRSTYQLITSSFKNITLKQVILSISWFWFIGSIFLMKLPIYTREYLHGDEGVFTLFLALFSVGIALGSALCHKLSKGKLSWSVMQLGFVGLTISIALFLAVSFYSTHDNVFSQLGDANQVSQLIHQPLFIALIVIFTGIALFSGMYIVPLYTAMQAQAKAREIGRVIATNNVINAFSMVVASILALTFAHFELSLLWNFLVLAAVNCVLIVIFLIKKPLFLNQKVLNQQVLNQQDLASEQAFVDEQAEGEK